MNCTDIVTEAANRNFSTQLKIVIQGDADYDSSRAISNSRLNYKPCAIAKCLNEEHISFCITYCSINNISFTVKSGGHHHDGMCSGDGVLVIDLSGMNVINLAADNNTAWVQPGTKLVDFNKTIAAANVNRIFPGGGCEFVCIGGLAQGGGWGPYARKFGLTCDNILEATVVLANGNVVSATANNENQDLFWAVRGGGGGNFGVISNYRVQLYPNPGNILSFSLDWFKDKMEDIISKWINESPGFTNDLTTGMRIKVIDDGKETTDNTSVRLAGTFFGTQADLKTILDPFYKIGIPVKETFTPVIAPVQDDTIHDEMRSAAIADSHFALGRALQLGPDPFRNTCVGPLPHKVSSAFYNGVGVLFPGMPFLDLEITRYFAASTAKQNANLYINLMSLGGAIKTIAPDATAFYYRTRHSIIQFQAWWSDPADTETQAYLDWIKNFRKALVDKGLVKGAFVNFPDINLYDGSNMYNYLKNYYDSNIDRLRTIKTAVDPFNIFSSGMSIPPVKVGLISPFALTSACTTNIHGDLIICSIVNSQRLPVNMLWFGGITNEGFIYDWQSFPLKGKQPATGSSVSLCFNNENAASALIWVADKSTIVPPSLGWYRYLYDPMFSPNQWSFQALADTQPGIDPSFGNPVMVAATGYAPNIDFVQFICAINDKNELWHSSLTGPFGKIANAPPARFVAIASTFYSPYIIHTLIIDTNGALLHTSLPGDYDGSQSYVFSRVTDQTDKVQSNPETNNVINVACSTNPNSGDLDVCIITQNQNLWHTVLRADGSWQAFVKISEAPVSMVSVSCTTTFKNELHICVTDNNGNLWHSKQVANAIQPIIFTKLMDVSKSYP